uniref:Uncharacterized protein n=1 Tax=Tanacetum cinerariifolium TaxID=118510 RepID=A0A6L2JFZ3_TANCI|nr:hypothetical protein [Tanacetum cinerariifolium]
MDVSANTIANCFRHCKLRSTDNMTFENSDEGGESTQELQNLIKELGYRNAMDVEDVLTHPEENVVAQLLTDEEIVESVIGINKDDIDEKDDEKCRLVAISDNRECIRIGFGKMFQKSENRFTPADNFENYVIRKNRDLMSASLSCLQRKHREAVKRNQKDHVSTELVN